MTAVSASDIWAVGVTSTGGLALHWSGTAWTLVTLPAPSVAGSQWSLYDVTATSDGSVWAVGSVTDPGGLSSHPIVEQFKGGTWTLTQAPGLGSNAVNGFSAVRAVSPSDVWAVGNSGPGNQTFVTLTEHFDGNAWTVAPSPNRAGQNNGLTGVASAGSGQWWAVGSSYPPATGLQQTLVEHLQ